MSSMTGSSAVDHLGGDERDAGLELRAVLGRGRELGADDEQLALQPHQQLVELGAALGLGAGEAERGHRFVDRAVRVGAGVSLATRPP